jgi:hypothetical protein
MVDEIENQATKGPDAILAQDLLIERMGGVLPPHAAKKASDATPSRAWIGLIRACSESSPPRKAGQDRPVMGPREHRRSVDAVSSPFGRHLLGTRKPYARTIIKGPATIVANPAAQHVEVF